LRDGDDNGGQAKDQDRSHHVPARSESAGKPLNCNGGGIEWLGCRTWHARAVARRRERGR
jgi:hypothetical protein